MTTALAVKPSYTLSITSSEDTNILFGQCSAKVRCKIMDKVACMQEIDVLIASGVNQKQGIYEISKRYHGSGGFSKSKLAKDYALWSRGGQKPNAKGIKSGPFFEARDWKMFVPQWNNGQPETALNNKQFVTLIRRWFTETTRKDATAAAIHNRLLDEWFAGSTIDGYGNIYKFCAENGMPLPKDRIRRSCYYPRGWSVDNIRKMLPQSRAYRSLVQQGEHAAHDHWGAQLLRDRSKLMPFELVTLDDVRCDIRVLMEIPGKEAQIVYPEAVVAMDVATGMIIASGFTGNYVRAEDMDGGLAGTKRGIQQADTRFLLQSILETYGVPQNWQMTVLIENASASLGNADQKAFEQLTGIKIEHTGLVKRSLLKSGFVEQGGYPWQKGWIESFFHLFHTRTNHLPGTVGRSYDLTKGHADNEAKYALQVCREAFKKGCDIKDLKLPLLTLDQYQTLVEEYFVRLNWRTNHQLQGFDKVYEVETEPGVFLRYDDPRADPYINNGTVFQTRIEAPIERFQRLLRGQPMPPIHPSQLMPLGMEKKEVTVKKGKITINRARQDNLVFFDAESASQLDHYDSRNKALIGFLSADQGCIHLFTNDENLVYVASPRNVERVDITNREEILTQAGEVDRSRQRIRDEVAALMEPKNQEYADMRRHNTALLESAEKAAGVASAIEKVESQNRKEKRLSKANFGTPSELLDTPINKEQPTDATVGWNVSELL